MLNKKVRNIMYAVSAAVTLVLVLYLFAAAVTGGIRYRTEVDSLELNRSYGIAGMIKLTQRSGIDLGDEFKKTMKEKCSSTVSLIGINTVGSSEIAKMICIDSVFDYGMKDELFYELNRRIDTETGLFDEYYNDSYDGLDADTIYAMKLASTDALMISLDAFSLTDADYDVFSALANAYNSSLDKYDHNDIYNKNWTISAELENIFYYYLITDRLDCLDYEMMWNRLGSDYVRNLFETGENNESFREKSVANISGILTDLKAHMLGANITVPYTPQEYYEILDTEEAFKYDASAADEFEYSIFVYLSNPKDLDLSKNQFFADNIGKWLSR